MVFEFNGDSIPSGSAAWSELQVTEDADATNLSIPAYVMHGGDGPVLWIQGCVHGPEHAGGLSLRDFLLDASPQDIDGTIIGVPIVNRSAFANKQRESPVDGKDLNRNFPGDPDGTFTEQLAHRLFSTVTKHADYVVDLHTGGDLFFIPGYSIFPPVDGVEETTRELCVATGLSRAVGASIDTFAGAMYSAVANEGIPAIVVETGGEGRLHEQHMAKMKRAIEGVAQHLSLLPGEVEHDDTVEFYEELSVLRAHHGGFFECYVSGDEPVTEGQRLAEITDYRGNVKEVFEAPYDAVPIAVQTYGAVRPGDWTFELVPR